MSSLTAVAIKTRRRQVSQLARTPSRRWDDMICLQHDVGWPATAVLAGKLVALENLKAKRFRQGHGPTHQASGPRHPLRNPAPASSGIRDRATTGHKDNASLVASLSLTPTPTYGFPVLRASGHFPLRSPESVRLQLRSVPPRGRALHHLAGPRPFFRGEQIGRA